MRWYVLTAVLGLAAVAPACSATVQPDVSRLHGDGSAAGLDASTPGSDGGGTCAPGLVACSGGCADVSTDTMHCGGCGRSCAAGQACVSGVCACTGAGCVVTPAGVGDPFDCGPMHLSCPADRACVDGACACRPPTVALPDGRCVDLLTDPRNCGMPGQACADACVAGRCAGGCPDGLADCNGHCVDLRRDPQSCGDCGARCAADQICIAGNCEDYRSTEGCNTCPCPACGGDFGRCCRYPGLDLAVCVDAGSCP